MDSRLKQRLIGAAVLVALAVIFLPMLVQGPAPDSGVSDVPLAMPDAPRGAYETRDLPLVTPGATPAGGAVGMNGEPGAAGATAPAVPAAGDTPTPDTTVPDADASPSTTAPLAEAPAASDAHALPAKPASADMFPAPTAGGDYAVSFGTYATVAAADALVGSLRASQLPGYRESAQAGGKSAWRVRIGPYASRAAAEAARLRAAHVRDDVGASVVTLDVTPARTSTPPPATPTASAPRSEPTPSPPAATPPVAPAAAPAVGFAVQLAAFSKAADATALRDKLRAAGFSAFTESVATDHGTLTRVRAGPVQSHAEAEQLQAQVKAKLGLSGVIRPHP